MILIFRKILRMFQRLFRGFTSFLTHLELYRQPFPDTPAPLRHHSLVVIDRPRSLMPQESPTSGRRKLASKMFLLLNLS